MSIPFMLKEGKAVLIETPKTVMEMVDGSFAIIDETKGYNPNRAKDGKFTFGKTASGTSTYDEEFDGGTRDGKDDREGIFQYVRDAPEVELNEDQIESVAIYVDAGHVSINQHLRNNKPTAFQDQLPLLDEAIDKGYFYKDTVVYRGADLGDSAAIDQIINSGSFIENGYSSTSLSQTVAADFSKNSPGSVLFRIHRRANDSGLLARKSNAFVVSPQEFEYILPRGTQFYVAYDGWVTVRGTKIRMVGLE